MRRSLCVLGVLATACDAADPTPAGPAAPGGPVPACAPPALEVLDDIPDLVDLEVLDDDVPAAFEIDGDRLVGKLVRDRGVAQGALGLWQELVMRIPRNQRSQLVQLTLFASSDLAAFVDNVGTGNQVGRYGPSLYLNVSNIADNDPDPCAPLSGRRGTFDWTLIHELGHLRQYADGTVDAFVDAFDTPVGDGEGYPDDGTPSLDGDFVSSYAERAGGDEDAAESFTAFVMLDALPVEDTVAADKVRFFADRADYTALRQALRVTEPGGGGDVPPAPLLSFDLEIDNPQFLVGSWEGMGPNGPVAYEITSDNIVFREIIDGTPTEMSYGDLRDDGTLATVRVVESNDAFHLLQVAIGDHGFSETFEAQGQTVLVQREGLGTFTLTPAG